MKYSLLILLALISYGNTAKILGVFPFPSKSHWILGSALLKELAKRGHEVTMLSPFPLKDPPERYTDVHMRGLLENKDENMSDMLKGNQSTLNVMMKTIGMITKMTRDCTGNEDLLEFVKRGEKFDLVIQLNVFMNEALLGVGHSLNATTIGFSVIGSNPFNNYLSGNPAPYAYVPSMVTYFSDDMNFLQRVQNTLSYIATDLLIYFVVLPYQARLLKEFFPNAPPLQELLNKVDLTLVNSHIATETPRPYLPNIIQIGGFHLQETEKLPLDVESFLTKSKHGVVYFSLGSNAKSSLLPVEFQNEILKAFKNIKYDVLWVHDGQLTNKPKNVMITKWAPQRAVLAHPNVKLFITHAGLGGTVEAIYFGKPMICIPLFGDQHRNAADSVSKGFAISLNKNDLTEDLLVDAINEVMENPTYRTNIELKSDIYKNQPLNPMDKAVFWVEHVLKHKGAKHLKAKAAHIPLYQYLLLDAIGFISVVLLTLSLISYYIMKFLCRLCFCKSKKLKKLKTK